MAVASQKTSAKTGKVRKTTARKATARKATQARGPNGKFGKSPVGSDNPADRSRRLRGDPYNFSTDDALVSLEDRSAEEAMQHVGNTDVSATPPQSATGSPVPTQGPPTPGRNSSDNLGNHDVPVARAKPPLQPAKGRKTSLFPRRTDLPPEILAERRAQWAQRWSCKPVDPVTQEEMLRASFWGYGDAKPRCYSCRNMASVLSKDGPDGTEEGDLLPCGCLYEASLLEMWCVKKGMFEDLSTERKMLEELNLPTEHLGPKTWGKHKMLLLKFWEMLFGPFSCDTLVNLHGQRELMFKKFNDAEANALCFLAPNPGFVKLKRNSKKKRKASYMP